MKARDGTAIALEPLAEEICSRYRAAFPDEQARYGEAGIAWCLHDNQHILNWAFADASGVLKLEDQLIWLAGVLEARDFPRARLVRNLELAADVTEAELGQRGAAVVGRLRDGAALLGG